MSRSIFIGDVHGCAVELAELLDRLGLGSDDRVWFVGDLVARGPNTKGVLSLVREVRGACVRGNHEQRLLEARAAHGAGEPGPRLGMLHAQLLESLTEEEWEQLESFPFTIEVPEHGVRVVHAGLIPGLPLSQHGVGHFTRLRTISEDGSPSDRLAGTLWGRRWIGPPHVVFGHNAVSGLQLHRDATGLDTGCVYGGRLSALVLPSGSPVPPTPERVAMIVSVPARDRYYIPGAS